MQSRQKVIEIFGEASFECRGESANAEECVFKDRRGFARRRNETKQQCHDAICKRFDIGSKSTNDGL